MKKVFTFIKQLIVGIIGIIFFAFAITVTTLLLNFNDYGVTQLGDNSLIIIKDRMAFDKYDKGALVLVKAAALRDITIGDEVFIYKITKTTNNKSKVSIDLGIIGAVHEDDDAVSFETGETYSSEFIIGKADKIYNDVGTYLSIVESTWGFLFIILVPSFLIFVYEIYALIIEIKYGGKTENKLSD